MCDVLYQLYAMYYTIELVSLNVNGLGDNFKRQSMFFMAEKNLSMI